MREGLASTRGQTIVDFLVTISIFGFLISAALPHFDPRRQDINTALATIQGDFRMTRAKAITTGVHFSVNMVSDGQYEIQRHREQVDTWPVDTVTNTVTFPDSIRYWMYPSTLEFNTRGMMITSVDGNPEPAHVYVHDVIGNRLHAFSVWPSGQINEEF